VASAGGKYNPEETVFEVKKRRLGITSVVADAPKVSALSAESDGMT